MLRKFCAYFVQYSILKLSIIRPACSLTPEYCFGICLGSFLLKDFYLRSSNWIINVKLCSIQVCDCAVLLIWQVFGSVTWLLTCWQHPVLLAACARSKAKLTSVILKNEAPDVAECLRGFLFQGERMRQAGSLHCEWNQEWFTAISANPRDPREGTPRISVISLIKDSPQSCEANATAADEGVIYFISNLTGEMVWVNYALKF